MENNEEHISESEMINTSEVRTGQIEPAELEMMRKVASKMGWKPEDEWNQPDKVWTDADEFLEYTPKKVKALKDSLKTARRMEQAVGEEARRLAKAEIEAELREAVSTGNVDKALAAANKAQQANDPRKAIVEAWASKNPWFSQDPEAAAFARSITDHMAAQGRTSFEDQLEAAENAVRKRFPEHFEHERPVAKATPRVAPVVQQATNTVRTRVKEFNWDSMPSTVRSSMNRQVKEMAVTYKKSSEADIKENLARAYWKDQGEIDE